MAQKTSLAPAQRQKLAKWVSCPLTPSAVPCLCEAGLAWLVETERTRCPHHPSLGSLGCSRSVPQLQVTFPWPVPSRVGLGDRTGRKPMGSPLRHLTQHHGAPCGCLLSVAGSAAVFPLPSCFERKHCPWRPQHKRGARCLRNTDGGHRATAKDLGQDPRGRLPGPRWPCSVQSLPGTGPCPPAQVARMPAPLHTAWKSPCFLDGGEGQCSTPYSPDLATNHLRVPSEPHNRQQMSQCVLRTPHQASWDPFRTLHQVS